MNANWSKNQNKLLRANKSVFESEFPVANSSSSFQFHLIKIFHIK